MEAQYKNCFRPYLGGGSEGPVEFLLALCPGLVVSLGAPRGIRVIVPQHSPQEVHGIVPVCRSTHLHNSNWSEHYKGETENKETASMCKRPCTRPKGSKELFPCATAHICQLGFRKAG